MNKKLFVFLIFTCFNVHHVNAQIGLANAHSGVTPGMTKNATTPGSDVYSPDLFTGTVNVNIPIYNYSVDGLNLGVSLSYNTLGIKLDEVASNVGLGWTLNTGGIITRETHGVEDELTQTPVDTAVNPSSLSTTAWREVVGEQRGNWVDNLPRLPSGSLFPQEEPDIFTAVLGDRTIKFAIKNWSGPALSAINSMRVYTSPNRDISVDIYFTDTNLYAGLHNGYYNRVPLDIENFSTNNYILRFKIIDERGNQFFFDRGDYQLRLYDFKGFHTTVNRGSKYYLVPCTWVLSKVITFSGAVINYTYVDDAYSYPEYKNQQVKIRDNFTNPGSYTQTGNIAVINEEVIRVMHGKRLTQITYPNGDVVSFNVDGIAGSDIYAGSDIHDDNALSSIKVQSGYDAFVKNSYTYKFIYKYFYSSTLGSSYEASYPTPSPSISNSVYSLRLKLKNIDKIGTDNTTTENYYKFSYIGDDPSEPHLSSRLSGFNDYWGYYSGVPPTPGYASHTGSTHAYDNLASGLSYLTTPVYNFSFTDNLGYTVSGYFGKDLSPNWTYAKAGLLKKVTNGTGGSVQFSYQKHNLTNIPDCSSFISSAGNTGYFDHDIYYQFFPWGSYHIPTDGILLPYDGVCIDKIVSSDGYNSDNTTTTSFDFSDGAGNPGGIKFFYLGYYWYPTILSNDIYPYNVNLFGIEKIYQNSFVNPMDLINGSNHGYTHARVTTKGYGGDILSDKAYTFTNIEPNPTSDMGETITFADYTGPPPHTINASWSRLTVACGLLSHSFPREYFDKGYMGLLKELDEYDNVSHLVTQTLNSYNENQYHDSIDASITSYFGVWAGGTFSPYILRPYFLYYTPFTKSVVNLTRSITRNYSGGAGSSTEVVKNYAYDSNDDLLSVSYLDSKGRTIKEMNIYDNFSYTEYYRGLGANPYKTKTIRYLANKTGYIGPYINSSVGMTYDSHSANTYYSSLGNKSSLLGPGILVSGPIDGGIHFNKVYTFLHNEPIYPPIYITDYLLAKDYQLYDDHNNVLQTGYNNDQNFSSAIWDTRIGQKVAEVSNAKYRDIAYTSFEGRFTALGIADYNKGNWDFDTLHIVLGTSTAKAMTGRYYYSLTGSSIYCPNPPQDGKKYIISLWYKGALPVISSVFGVTFATQFTAGDWKLATAIIVGNGASHVNITPSGASYIDELRMFPLEASMDTYTYEPLIGVSSHCDERNNITYYEYDAMGRPTITRDTKGNIISLTKNVVQGSDN